MSNPYTPSRAFWKIVGAIILSLGTGAGLFFGGFTLGDKWSGIKREKLIITIDQQESRIGKLNERVLLLQRTKPEVANLVDKLLAEDILFVGSSISKDTVKRGKWLALYRNKTVIIKDAVFLTYTDRLIDNSEGEIVVIGFGNYRTKTKYLNFKIGDTFKFIIDGISYIVLIKGFGTNKDSLQCTLYEVVF